MLKNLQRGLFIVGLIILGLLALPETVAAQGEAFAAGIVGLVIFIYIVIFIVIILIAIWVYRDAESRGMSGVLWLIVVLVGSIIGLIIYLVIRRDHPVLPPGYRPPPGGYPPPGYYPPPPGYYPPPPQPPPR